VVLYLYSVAIYKEIKVHRLPYTGDCSVQCEKKRHDSCRRLVSFIPARWQRLSSNRDVQSASSKHLQIYPDTSSFRHDLAWLLHVGDNVIMYLDVNLACDSPSQPKQHVCEDAKTDRSEIAAGTPPGAIADSDNWSVVVCYVGRCGC
jgi:hypothetical protein